MLKYLSKELQLKYCLTGESFQLQHFFTQKTWKGKISEIFATKEILRVFRSCTRKGQPTRCHSHFKILTCFSLRVSQNVQKKQTSTERHSHLTRNRKKILEISMKCLNRLWFANTSPAEEELIKKQKENGFLMFFKNFSWFPKNKTKFREKLFLWKIFAWCLGNIMLSFRRLSLIISFSVIFCLVSRRLLKLISSRRIVNLVRASHLYIDYSA